MNSNKFRKHPGGYQSVIRFVNVFLLIGMVAQFVMVVAAIMSMMSDQISLAIVSAETVTQPSIQSGMHISTPRIMGFLVFEARNFIDWIVLPRQTDFDLYIGLISLMVTWQLYRIFKAITIEQPFFQDILKRMRYVHRCILLGIVISILRYFYIVSVVRDFGHQNYTLRADSYLSSTGYFTIGTWVVVYFFTHVYKKGLVLQQDNELTI